MFESPIKISSLIGFAFLSSLIVIIIFLASFFDKRTKIVFCNVGQGDAAYIRIENRIDVLIDAGPDRSVLACLGRYMPFWDRKIEMAFLSHPNDDHYNGYSFITERYKIDRFITVKTPFTPKTYRQLLNKMTKKNIVVEYGTSGNIIKVDHDQFIIYWPPIDFMSSNDNDFSSVILFECCRGPSRSALTILFTGDASPFILGRLSHGAIEKIDILKVPHHGSKNGLTKTFLDLANPTTAVISVGKGNSYGHPHNEVLDILKAKNIQIKRTDIDGDILFRIKN